MLRDAAGCLCRVLARMPQRAGEIPLPGICSVNEAAAKTGPKRNGTSSNYENL